MIEVMSKKSTDSGETSEKISQVCDDIKNVLIEKNRRYGDAAFHPVRIFSKADPTEQLRVRLDDKISRIRSEQIDDDEDAVMDLLGYLILYIIAREIEVKI